jgi:hypothetical protein
MNREFRRLCTIVGAGLVATALAACGSHASLDIGRGQTGTGATTDFGIAYIKRVLPTDPLVLAQLRLLDDLRHQRTFWSKADVYIRDKASPGGVERNITARLTGTNFYDIKHLDVSADGQRLVFAMRGPLLATMKDFEQPTWRIYEYDIAADNLHSLTDDVTASEGQDVSPHYLPSDSTHPNGRILITSTRQRYSKGVLLQEGKSGFEAQTEDGDESAFTLNVLDPTLTGPSAFQQISFNQSHDLDPSVMSNGRILFTRWDHAPGGTNAMHLYTMNPDGSDLQLLYGAHSHEVGTTDPTTGLPTTVQFVKTRQLQSGQVLALIRPVDPGSDFGGNLVVLDVVNSVECTQRTLAAGVGPGGSNPCPAQSAATSNDVRTIPGPSPGGRFNSAYPLWDNTNRILVSWSQCRLIDSTGTIVPCTAANLALPNPKLAPPLYSAWLFDPADNTLKPVVTPTEGVMLTDLVTLQARTAPAFVAPVGTGSTLAGDGLGIIDVRSVYDWADAKWVGTGMASTASFISTMATTNADARPARFLRLEKAVSMGDKNLLDGFPNFDRNIALDNSVGYMREILGYVPIEADGSVRVKVPANVAFQMSILDANARRIATFPQHRAWLQLRPGEVIQCNGCHDARTPASVTAHGRAGLFAPANTGDATGKTLAQLLYGTATNCAVATCSAAAPSVDVKYTGSGAAGDTSISLTYNPGLTTPLPTTQSCLNSWSGACRITIDYDKSGTGAATLAPAHIHPLWKVDRGANTCVNCHTAAARTLQCTPAGASTPITVMIPAGNPQGGLALDDDPAQQATAQLRAYQQLVTNHTSSTYAIDTACVVTLTTVQVNASIVSGSAAASSFFAVLSGATTGTVNHSGFMTPAELRLLSEWVDIGAQYYNNPFAAPLKN